METGSMHDNSSQHAENGSASNNELQSQTRKRRGSLRKTALLGPGRFSPDKRTPNADAQKLKSPSKGDNRPRALPYDEQIALPSGSPQRQRSTVLSPLSGTLDQYTSTTDEDESIPLIPGTFQRATPLSSRASSDSSIKGLRESFDTTSEPTSAIPHAVQSPLLQPDEWDYSATERWGWIILVATWVVFVVGMGSCLGIWSWAWDVGETPYAPPELEDDPTLPIVGYYPALIVLTAVMSWVWVIVAWVGMKYFKHAKIQSEDG